MTARLLELAGVDYGYRDTPVLHGVDLAVAAGRIRALVGLNGAGKTTLMRIALGTAVPHTGTATVLGCDPATAPPRIWTRVGHLLDTAATYRELTGRECVYSAARLRGLSRAEAATAAEAAIAEFGLGDEAGKRVKRLSTGNRQRVALAAAMAHRPELLILDEPTIALDPLAVVRLREALRAATDRGAGVLVSSHHLDEVARIADDITVLHRGRVVDGLEPGQPDLEQRFFDLVYRMEKGAAR